MRLTPREKAVCREYSARDEEGKVHCNDCPLRIEVGECKATVTAKEWKKWEKERDQTDKR